MLLPISFTLVEQAHIISYTDIGHYPPPVDALGGFEASCTLKSE